MAVRGAIEYDESLQRFKAVETMTSEPVQYLKFDDLPPDRRLEIAAAASRFLLSNDYASVYEACELLDLDLQHLWDKIMDEAGLPRCEHPGFGMVC